MTVEQEFFRVSQQLADLAPAPADLQKQPDRTNANPLTEATPHIIYADRSAG
jgi:hypothetical protein